MASLVTGIFKSALKDAAENVVKDVTHAAADGATNVAIKRISGNNEPMPPPPAPFMLSPLGPPPNPAAVQTYTPLIGPLPPVNTVTHRGCTCECTQSGGRGPIQRGGMRDVTLTHLRELARSHNVPRRSRMNRAQLIDALEPYL